MDRKSSARVEVQIAPALATSLSASHLKAVTTAALDHLSTQGQMTLVITGDGAIQALNRDFLGKDAPTDVLAFSAQEDGGPFVASPEAGHYLGDVIVSYPRAVAQAGEACHTVEQELNLLIVHGLLHLLGYDHAGSEEEAAMWAIQAETLAAI
jgi:probable rRNA maturation factor